MPEFTNQGVSTKISGVPAKVNTWCRRTYPEFGKKRSCMEVPWS